MFTQALCFGLAAERCGSRPPLPTSPPLWLDHLRGHQSSLGLSHGPPIVPRAGTCLCILSPTIKGYSYWGRRGVCHCRLEAQRAGCHHGTMRVGTDIPFSPAVSLAGPCVTCQPRNSGCGVQATGPAPCWMPWGPDRNLEAREGAPGPQGPNLWYVGGQRMWPLREQSGLCGWVLQGCRVGGSLGEWKEAQLEVQGLVSLAGQVWGGGSWTGEGLVTEDGLGVALGGGSTDPPWLTGHALLPACSGARPRGRPLSMSCSSRRTRRPAALCSTSSSASLRRTTCPWPCPQAPASTWAIPGSSWHATWRAQSPKARSSVSTSWATT